MVLYRPVTAFLLAAQLLFTPAFAQEGGEDLSSPSAGSTSGSAGDAGPLRYWLGAGPTLVVGASTSFGARISLGVDVEFPRSPVFFGMYISKPFSGESIDGRFSGTVSRTHFMPNVGIYLVPDRVWLRAGLGLGYLSGSNPDMSAKIKPAFGLAAGWKMALSNTWDAGIEFSYEYTGRAKQSINFLADSIECGFGDCDAFGTIPRANNWALNFVIGLKP